eukprot:162226-Hanusia_phi.AAC.1
MLATGGEERRAIQLPCEERRAEERRSSFGEMENVSILSEAICSWCDRYSMHLLEERRLLRKDSFRCSSCGKICCPCDNVDKCGGYAKCLPYWDEALCTRCGFDQPPTQNKFLDHILRRISEKQDQSTQHTPEERLNGLEAQEDLVDNLVQHTSTAIDVIRQSSEQWTEHLASLFQHKAEPTSSIEERRRSRELMESCKESGSLQNSELMESCKESGSLQNSEGCCVQSNNELSVAASLQAWEQVRDNLLGMDTDPHRLHVSANEEILRRRAFVMRWLRSSHPPMDVQQTTDRLLKHLKWRYDEGINEIQNENWEEFDADGDLYVSGLDKFNRPSCTWRIAKAKRRKPQAVVRYLICTIERARAVNPDADGINFLFDCTGTTLSSFENLFFLDFIGVLQENYPENLIRCFVFPVNWVTKQLFEFGKPLLSQETKSKLMFFRKHDIENELTNFFDVEEIEKSYGGSLQLTLSELRTRR